MPYYSNRRGVRLGDERYELGAEVPDLSGTNPFDRYVRRGFIVYKEAAKREYGAMTKPELFAELEARGIVVAGNLKADLVAALEHADADADDSG